MEKILAVLPPITYVAFLLAEHLFPARRLPASRWWRLKGVLFFLLGGAIIGAVPNLWAAWVRDHRVFNLEGLGTAAGTLVAIVFTDLLVYWMHRLRHGWTPLWRLHQTHHSAERLDVSGAFFFHPLETLLFAFVSTFVAALVLGVTPLAAALTGYFGCFVSVLTHANLATPRGLGFVIQRPEGHAVHHERGVHAYNYGALALWDAVFGTYRNPRERPAEAGFWDGASARLGALMWGADVARRPAREAQARRDAGAARAVAGRAALSIAALAAVGLGSIGGARADGEATRAPPREVTQLFERMLGTWTAKEVTTEHDGQSSKGTSQVTCAAAAGGGVRCELKVSMPGMHLAESDLFGWDPETRRIHMLAVSPRSTHDHIGVIDGDTLRLVFDGTRASRRAADRPAGALSRPTRIIEPAGCAPLVGA